MHVIIVGAGVIGVTTAYFLQSRGCEVTVVDGQSEPARECSYANGGFFSVLHEFRGCPEKRTAIWLKMFVRPNP